MTPNLTTQFHRALFALPLLVVGVAGAASHRDAGAATEAVPSVHVVLALPGGAATTLPDAGLAMERVPMRECAVQRDAGARGLARMPGDLTALAGRLRCAQ